MKHDEVEAHRRKIAEIDSEIVELVAKRLEAVERIGRIKSSLGMPIRDFKVEAEVVKRIRERCARRGIEKGFGEGLAQLLIDESVRIQNNFVDRSYGGNKLRALVVGGRGAMGAWFAKFLRSQGHRVAIHDIAGALEGFDYESDLIVGSRRNDLILLSTPISVTAALLARIAEAKPEGTVFDICSLKTPIASSLRHCVSKGVKVASLHPLFGPNTGSLAGRNILLSDCGSKEAMETGRSIFKDTGANLIEVSLDEHDPLMACVLGMSHAINIAFFNALAESGRSFDELIRVSSSTFAKQVATAKDVGAENPLLYYEIQSLNPHTSEVLDGVSRALENLRNAIDSRSSEAFVKLMENGKRYFGGA